MAYPYPIIRIRENNRHIDRGCYYDAEMGRHMLQFTNLDTRLVLLDLSDILADASIDDVSISSSGISTASTSSGGVITLTLSNLSAVGDIDITTTLDDGRIRTDFLRVHDPFCWSAEDYGPVKVVP